MRENHSLEFKSEITNTFLKTVSAFANFGDGVIQFGICDDGSVCGISNPEQACLDIENKINDSINPKPDFLLSINRRNGVITLSVYEGSYKPYFYKGKAYRRSDTASVEVDQIELKRLALEGSNLYFDELVYKDKELVFNSLAGKMREKLNVTEVSTDMLRTLGFINDKGEYNNAAALVSDNNDFFGIDIAKFGNSISEIMDHETYSNCSILDQYENTIKVFKRYYLYEKVEGFYREQKELIPEEAFREAIANALVHRTWDVNAHIRVSMFDDRIEISSPGGLPKGLTKEEYLRGNISSLRNPIIGNLFYRLHYIEMFGTGIRRIIESYRDFSDKPEFEIYDNSILIKLPAISKTYKTTSDGQKVIEILNSGLQLSSKEIASKLGWSKDKAIRTLNSLIETGYVHVYGKGRATKYTLEK